MAGLTGLELRLFGYVQSADRITVVTGELVAALGITPLQERKLLSRMARRGLIARVRRGLYLVPSQLPTGGRWTPSDAMALSTLMSDVEGRYQISGPNAFNRYGWDEQIPNRLFVYNDRISGDRKIGAVTLTLIKVGRHRLGSTEIVRTPEGITMTYASKTRALMDAVYDWARFNSLPRAFDWIREEIARDDRIAGDLVSMAIKYGNQGTLRRIGKLLETAGVPEPLLRKIGKALRPTTSFIPWIPNRPKRGRTNNRWRVVDNDGERAESGLA